MNDVLEFLLYPGDFLFMLLRQPLEFASFPAFKFLTFLFQPRFFVLEVGHAPLQLFNIVGRFQVCCIQVADRQFQHRPGKLKSLCNF